MGEAGPIPAAASQVLTRTLTSFVGRSAAITKLAELISEYHLITVTGPGGVGKTRLADEVLRQVAGRFADGVSVVELAGVQDAGLVPATVATVLGLQRIAGASVADAVADRLSRQQVLLVLDNCEHVLDAVAELCAQVLPAADDIRILATSREPLGLPEEARYRLQPLALPGQADLAEANNGDAALSQVAESEAVNLFVERARQVDPDLYLDGRTRPVVGRLVQHLDGIPLAIELAAARVEALGLEQLLELLDDRMRLLVSSNRGAPARQRSLKATVDWSYQLLTETERRAFRFLSILPGPFTLEAAEAVAGAGTRIAVMRLVDCSLLTPPRTGPDGRARYLMLESLRGFGLDRLRASGEEYGAASALAAYALDVAERAAAGLADHNQELSAARWLDAEDAALHQGLAWNLDHDPPAALRFAVAVAPWWVLRGRWVEGNALLQRALACNGPGASGWYTGHVVLLYELSLGSSDYGSLASRASVIVDALRSGPPSSDLVDGLICRSNTLRNMGALREASEDARSALNLAQQLRYLTGEALALTELGYIAMYGDEGEEALRRAQQAQEVDLSRIPPRRARWVRLILLWALLSSGRLAHTADLLQESLAAARDVGDLGLQADVLFITAVLTRRTGNLADSGSHLWSSARIALSIGYPMRLIDVLDEAGMQCVAAKRYAEAITLWAAMAVHNAATGLADTAEGERYRAEPVMEARSVLGPERFEAAEKRGAGMTLVAAVEYALMNVNAEAAASSQAPPRTTAAEEHLSVRERELVTLVAQGQTDAQIAEKLFISISTVRTHLDRIRDKTGCRRRADLTRYALSEGII